MDLNFLSSSSCTLHLLNNKRTIDSITWRRCDVLGDSKATAAPLINSFCIFGGKSNSQLEDSCCFLFFNHPAGAFDTSGGFATLNCAPNKSRDTFFFFLDHVPGLRRELRHLVPRQQHFPGPARVLRERQQHHRKPHLYLDLPGNTRQAQPLDAAAVCSYAV